MNKTVAWQNLEARLDENNKLFIVDNYDLSYQEVDFRDKLVDMTIGYGYLIVVTNTQCHLYNITTSNSINTPYKFDLKDKVRLILTCPKYFALIDDNNGLNVNFK